MFIQKIKICSRPHLGRKGLGLGVLKPRAEGKRSLNHSKHKTAAVEKPFPCSGTIHYQVPRPAQALAASSSETTEDTAQTCPQSFALPEVLA